MLTLYALILGCGEDVSCRRGTNDLVTASEAVCLAAESGVPTQDLDVYLQDDVWVVEGVVDEDCVDGSLHMTGTGVHIQRHSGAVVSHYDWWLSGFC